MLSLVLVEVQSTSTMLTAVAVRITSLTAHTTHFPVTRVIQMVLQYGAKVNNFMKVHFILCSHTIIYNIILL